jgi:membrane protease YdiL (CAAX protease family)
LKAFLSRLLLWRCPPDWVAFVVIGIPLIFVAGSLLKDGPALAPVPPEVVGALVAVLFMMLFLGPVEEFGWRGVAQPILQRYVAPISAGALIVAVWGIWHLPAFFLSGTVFGSWNCLPFFVGNVTLGVLVTPVFNRTGGGLFWPILFHWQLINPFWPDAQPYDTWILVAVTTIVVFWNRETMFRRQGTVTEVVPSGLKESEER